MGSIPDGVFGIFHWHNPSGRTNFLRLIQALTEMSNRNFLEQKRPVRRADNSTTFICTLSWNLRTSDSWNSQCLSRYAMGLLYFFVWKHSLNVLLNGLTEDNLVYLSLDGPFADFRNEQVLCRGVTRYRVSRRGRLHILRRREWHTLQELTLAQLDKLLYKWFTEMHSEGKPVTWSMVIENA